MPHEVPDDPTKMNIKQDKSTDIWRAERDTSDRPAGPMEVQRYQLQMENVGIQTFFKLPVAITPDDLVAGKDRHCHFWRTNGRPSRFSRQCLGAC